MVQWGHTDALRGNTGQAAIPVTTHPVLSFLIPPLAHDVVAAIALRLHCEGPHCGFCACEMAVTPPALSRLEVFMLALQGSSKTGVLLEWGSVL